MQDVKVVEEQFNTMEFQKTKGEISKKTLQAASEICCKNLRNKIIKTDQYGYMLKNEKDNEESKIENKGDKRKKLLRENARLEKWNLMLKDFNSYTKNSLKKLKSRTRKGIPDSLRGLIWQIYAEINHYRKEISMQNIFEEIMNDESTDLETEFVILKDIERTFPKHIQFKDKFGLGQRSLFNVLRAYSRFNKSTGYVQGMGFITALILTYMDEESTFWMIHSLMNKYNMRGYYEKDFPDLQRTFYKLLSLMKKHIPKVYDHFKKNSFHPSMYALQWFITIFAVNFKFDVLVRIYDVFLLEGEKVLYRLALAILKLSEEKLLLYREFENVLEVFKNIFDNIQADDLFNKAFKFSISKLHLREYDMEYDLVKGDTEHEIMFQVLN
jgi:hypothetical protein